MPAPDPQLPESLLSELLSLVGATDVVIEKTIQPLWSGYGCIVRLAFSGPSSTAVLKYIHPPASPQHPRGWNTRLSHQRKLRSYEVERQWYAEYASQCRPCCKVPDYLAAGMLGDATWILMEDLSVEFPTIKTAANLAEVNTCLDWLAHFHATFIHAEPAGLWPMGTYWHLQTRSDEYAAMSNGPLKSAASAIDRKLNKCRYQTLVHGDAKIANFCFASDESAVAAVDFQYVGGGIGSKDLAYFLGSCFEEQALEQYENRLLERYFKTLQNALAQKVGAAESVQICEQWRALYPVAWTDFYRFLQGWMPEHKKINAYTLRLAEQVLSQL